MGSTVSYNVPIIFIKAWDQKNSKKLHYEIMAPSLTLWLWVIHQTTMTRNSDLWGGNTQNDTL